MSKPIPESECDALISERTYRPMGWFNAPTLSVGKARTLMLVAQEAGLHGAARVNKALTRQQAFDILWATVADKPETEPLRSLVARNIWREFKP